MTKIRDKENDIGIVLVSNTGSCDPVFEFHCILFSIRVLV